MKNGIGVGQGDLEIIVCKDYRSSEEFSQSLGELCRKVFERCDQVVLIAKKKGFRTIFRNPCYVRNSLETK